MANKKNKLESKGKSNRLSNTILNSNQKIPKVDNFDFNFLEHTAELSPAELNLGNSFQNLEVLNKLQKHKEVLTSIGIDGTQYLGSIELKNRILPTVGVAFPELIQNILNVSRTNNSEILHLPAVTSKQTKKIETLLEQKGNNVLTNFQATKRSQTLSAKIEKKEIFQTQKAVMDNAINVDAQFIAQNVSATTTIAFPINTSYIAATNLTFSQDTIIELDTNVTDFIIIADQIIIGNSSKLTFSWTQPILNTTPQLVNVNGVDGNQDGINGIKGHNGSDGHNAPNIEIWTINPIKDQLGNNVTMANCINVNILGQNGGVGDNGQNGGTGGVGRNGEDSVEEEVQIFGLGVSYNCASGPKSGENGGRGGNGGNGGDGGTGGNGGNFELYCSNPTSLANIVYVNNAGGIGGVGGSHGIGGLGGRGGQRGAALGMCANKNWNDRGNGDNGLNGSDGGNGSNGFNGNSGNLFVPILINAIDYNTILNSPGIVSVSPISEKIRVNDSVSINGINLSALDTIKLTSVIGGVITIIPLSSITFLNTMPNQILSFSIPDIEGGSYEVQINNGSLFSNKIHIYILTTINSLSINRAKPNEQVTIFGTGFSYNTKVYLNNQMVAVQNYQNKNQTTFTVKRPTSFTPNMDGEIVILNVGDNYNNFSNALSFTIDTYKIIVIGDSIMACQGFDSNAGFTELIKQQIQQNNPDIGVYLDSKAHSGAIISGIDETDIEKDKEIPRPFPTINSQLNNASNLFNNSVELIIMDGGINDIKIGTFLKPEITNTGHQNRLNEITNKAQQYCYTELKNLLRNVGNKFINAKVVITGYYQVISSQSINLQIVSNFIGSQLGGSVLPLLPLGQIAFNNVIAQCAHARDVMNQNMLQAVNEINIELNTNRFIFVDVAFEEKNAIYAPESFLWELDPLLNVDDPQKANRQSLCSFITDNFDRSFCEKASTGHPNSNGRDRYFSKIMEVI